MSKLSRAKKQAKRDARKAAKKVGPSRPSKFVNGDSKKTSKTMTGRRNFQEQFQGSLRHTPVSFVKSTAMPDFEPHKHYQTTLSSSEDSDMSSESESSDNSSMDDMEIDTAPMDAWGISKFDQDVRSWITEDFSETESESEKGMNENEVEDDHVDENESNADKSDALKVGDKTSDAAGHADFVDCRMQSSEEINAQMTGPTRSSAPRRDKFENPTSERIGVLSDLEDDISDYEPDLDKKISYKSYYNDSEQDFEYVREAAPSSDRSDNEEPDYDDDVVDEEDNETYGDASDAEEAEDDLADLDLGLDTDSEADDSITITLDDFDESDASDSAMQDYMNNMSDLDDDQIFALAANQGIYKNEDLNVFDTQLDEQDPYFDQSSSSGVDPKDPMMVEQRKQKKQKKAITKESRRAAKSGYMQPSLMKYPDEITITEVVDELSSYAMSRRDNPKPLVFPPLDTNANWYIKQFAEYFDMTAKTSGDRDMKVVVVTSSERSRSRQLAGKIGSLLKRRQRFVRKDQGRVHPEIAAASQIYALRESRAKVHSGPPKINKDFYSMDRKKSAEKASKQVLAWSDSGIGLPNSSQDRMSQRPSARDEKARSARVRDGHIVGQHAAEIKNDNFGHRLMSQMGWTQGSGSGSGRAGIVAPIPATVKSTRGGLGCQ